MLEITFAVNGWEFFEGLMISSLKRTFLRAGMLIFPLLFLIGLLGVIRSSDAGWSIPMYAAILLVIIFLILTGVPALRAFQYSRNPQRSAPSTWRIGEKRIEIATDRGGAKVEWKTFARPVETWHLFLLHSAADKQTIYILPKRAFRDDAQREWFREMAKKAFGKFF